MELLTKSLLLCILVPCVHSTITLDRRTVDGAWYQFKLRYNVIPTEDFERREAFKESLRHVMVKNIAHELTGDEYRAGLNCASKLTPRERICSLSIKKKTAEFGNNVKESTDGFAGCKSLNEKLYLSSIDWVAQNRVFTPGCQHCSDCYAWAATYALSSALAIRGNRPAVELSVQEAKDCSYHVHHQAATNINFNNGCNGGNPYYVYDGLMINTNYTMTHARHYEPYNDRTGQLVCNKSRAMQNIEVTMRDKRWLPTVSDRDLERQLQIGPVAASMCIDYASANWVSHNNVPYQDLTCYATCQREVMTTLNTTVAPDVNHSVLIVGYTNTTWIIQNSYGPRWGANGVGHFTRNKTNNNRRICNLAYEISWPVL